MPLSLGFSEGLGLVRACATMPNRFSAAQVELTVSSVPAKVKQEYTTYSMPLLKTLYIAPEVQQNAQIGPVRKGEQVPDGKKTSQTAKFTTEKWSGRNPIVQ